MGPCYGVYEQSPQGDKTGTFTELWVLLQSFEEWKNMAMTAKVSLHWRGFLVLRSNARQAVWPLSSQKIHAAGLERHILIQKGNGTGRENSHAHWRIRKEGGGRSPFMNQGGGRNPFMAVGLLQ